MAFLRRIVTLCAILPWPLIAQAPAAESTERSGKFGIGVSLNTNSTFFDEDFGFLPFSFANILFPIRGKGVVIEPEFGLFRFSSETRSGGGSSSRTFRNFRAGVGVLAQMRAREQLQPYFGPRFGISRNSQTSQSSFGGGEQKRKQTDWYFSGVLGAQHFFTKHFSLGGEVQLTKIGFGAPDETPAPPSGFTEELSYVTTGAVATIRWFF